MPRSCGSCTLCCRLLPVGSLEKPALQKCEHQCAKGCKVYPKHPIDCQLWNCRWLIGEDVGLRPDRAGFVVDVTADFIVLERNDSGERTSLPVVQVWTDPEHATWPANNAALRAYLDRLGVGALVRIGNRDGYCMFPPSVTHGDWLIQHSPQTPGPQHTPAEINAVLLEHGHGR